MTWLPRILGRKTVSGLRMNVCSPAQAMNCCRKKRTFSSSSSVICQTTGPKILPKWFLHIVRSIASSFNWQYPLLSLRSSSSSLRLLSRLLVTSVCPFIFPSITYCRRQFLLKVWPIQLAFRFLISCRMFLCSLALSNTSSFITWSVQLIFSNLIYEIALKENFLLWTISSVLNHFSGCKVIFESYTVSSCEFADSRL